MDIRKTQLFINKHVYLSLSILELSKIVMQGFWYDNVKPKYGNKQTKLLYGYKQLYSPHKNIRYLRGNC